MAQPPDPNPEANRARAKTAQRDAERLDMALKAGRMGTWSFHIPTQHMQTSDIGREIFGLAPNENLTADEVLARVHPDDRKRRQKALAEAVNNRRDLDVEYRLYRHDGRIVWIQLRGRAEYGPDGQPEWVNGVSLDITERKDAEERLRLVLDELNHRVKNTLATVQSIAVQTRRTSDTPEAFSKALVARVEALARAHDLLTERSWDGALLKDVIAQTLAPYAMQATRRVTFDGPKIRLSPNAAVTLNMAFHELGTNAAKYGALAVEAGRVQVDWAMDNTTDPAVVEIIWREQAGPLVEAPDHRGFGSRLIEQNLVRELAGTVKLDFEPSGVVCRMRLAVSPKIMPV